MISRNSITIEELRQLGRSCGLDIVGVCNFEQLTREKDRLRQWQESGHAGEMGYMLRSPDLLTASEHLLAGARSVISCTINYSQDPHPALPSAHGRVARYAWGRDYHLVIPELLRALLKQVEQRIGRSLSARVFSDALPFLERAGARSAGLGFIGKNTMLIRKGTGSFFFIAEILWDLEVEQPALPIIQENSCGSCTRCIESCPTSAFIEPFVLHAPRCISYLTIEKRGAHTEQERRWLGEWIFGCDICQDVCPFNHATLKEPNPPAHSPLSAAEGVGPLLSLGEVLAVKSNREYEQRFSGTPLLRPGRTGLIRNALAVIANSRTVELSNQVAAIAEEAQSPTLRQTALWTLAQLAKHEGNSAQARYIRIRDILISDPDPQVSAEAHKLLALG